MITLDAELTAYRESVLTFASKHLQHDVIEGDEVGTFSHDGWKHCAEFGILGLPVPEAYGGSAAGMVATATAFEALGQACGDQGLLFAMNAHMWAVQHPILRFGTDGQKRRYLPGLCSGQLIGAHAMSEPDSGSDAAALRTTAERSDGGFVLNGSKTFVSNAPMADVFLVFASMDRLKGWRSVVAFLVDRDTPGLSTGPAAKKMGLRTAPLADVFLDDCFVPDDAVLGRPNGGMMIFNDSLERERSMILAPAVGAMARSLASTIDHARSRQQFGQPIGRFQAVSHRIVDMRLRLETSRLMLHSLAARIDAGQRVGLESALTKLHLSECHLAVTTDALFTLGGYGYMTEYEQERAVRDAFGSKLYSGTSDMQRNIAAQHLGL